MGIIGEIARHVGGDVVSDLALGSEQRREKSKWGALFGVASLLALLAFFIQHNSMKDADLLGGRETIEKFMHSNVAAMSILLAAALGYIVICFKTWKGRQGSMFQVIYTVAAGIIIIFAGVSIFRSIHNIQKDLDSPQTVTVKDYVLCMRGSDCMLAFDEKGTQDSVILVIPKAKYDELRKGEVSTKSYLSRAWRLVDDSQYTKYSDTAYYTTPLEITYYEYSIIYEDCKIKGKKQEN